MSSEPKDDLSGAQIEFQRTLEAMVGIPATHGNRIQVLRNGDEIFPAMLEAIENASRTIDFLTFVYWKGEIGKEFAVRLCERAKAGVRVRVLLDSWGARPIEKDLVDQMTSSGVQLHWFRPLKGVRINRLNHRTHRKVLVVDEIIGFTGGVGIADLWLGNARSEKEWRDTHFKIEGPSVDGLRAAFLENWKETEATLYDSAFDQFPVLGEVGNSTAQCVRGSSTSRGNDLSTVFRVLMQKSQHQLRIVTAYFVPDDDLVDRLCDAAGRGVQVQILLPGPHADKRFVQVAAEADYERLVTSGVEIWNFQPSMLHVKAMMIDGCVANVGSANFNARSMKYDEEINVIMFDTDVVRTLNEHFEEDLQRSIRINLQQWRGRTASQRVEEALVTPLRPLS